MTTATSLSIAEKEAKLNEMILQGNALEAFEEFYAEDVVMQDQDMGPWEGKDTNREREEDFFGKVTELHAIELGESAVGDDVTFSIWHYHYEHEEWGEADYEQVAVRHWNDDGLIEKERFYRG
jgi:ketosteroid isomerase-like protein